ncbi:protein of unknown function UPF0150 [Microseira wollei NIES-4236]|uniref:HicB-like antitoxin of toxin-antitoxin system domain-containing protein n=1 Tax=Microseira wollei NIES-4236 TaxID=2530354 RepID=A0AAV3X957_9CYAN|nr:type II toxin-antitoxin system HicB family antitoxin [Microseira wollei]GET36610.1 protein of unknown function UPF0150 [Microseira wollei NIES-4236]
MIARGEIVRQVLLYTDEDGYWIAECPSLPGCNSQGKTKQEAITNIKEAIELYIEVLQEKGQPIPEDRFDMILMVV